MPITIAIAGMGWVGKPLAQHLKTLGYTIKGSVTKIEKATQLQQLGFDVYPVKLSEEAVTGSYKGFLKNIETLVILIPPGLRRNTGANHVLKMTRFLEVISKAKIPNCILISSTSVYGNNQGKVTENDIPIPETEAGKQQLEVEKLFFKAPFMKTTIVRFGGLFGTSRQPVSYLAGRNNLNGGNAPVNLIHRDDCVEIITKIIKQEAYGHVFNAVYPEHPKKEAYYTKKALNLNIEPPIFNTSKRDKNYKEVHSINLSSILDYSFKISI